MRGLVATLRGGVLALPHLQAHRYPARAEAAEDARRGHRRLLREARADAAAGGRLVPADTDVVSGVQFRIKKEARRDANSPLSNAPCIVKYRGRLVDGTVFDPGNFDTPAVVKVSPDAAPPGWRSALHHMGEGDLWEVFVDPGLATQVQHLPNAPAPPNDQVLIYDLELVEVQGESRSRFHSWHVSSHVEL